MKTRKIKGSLLAVAVMALAANVALLQPARADDRHGHGHDPRGRGWYDHGHHWHGYAPPGVVYAPPPVVYAPPPQSPGLNLIVPLNIR